MTIFSTVLFKHFVTLLSEGRDKNRWSLTASPIFRHADTFGLPKGVMRLIKTSCNGLEEQECKKRKRKKKKIASSSYHSMEEESNHYFSQHRWEVVLKAVNAGSGFALPLGASADREVSDVNIPWALWRLQSIRLRDYRRLSAFEPATAWGKSVRLCTVDYLLAFSYSRPCIPWYTANVFRFRTLRIRHSKKHQS